MTQNQIIQSRPQKKMTTLSYDKLKELRAESLELIASNKGINSDKIYNHRMKKLRDVSTTLLVMSTVDEVKRSLQKSHNKDMMKLRLQQKLATKSQK